jgi:hypothetical protein
MAFSEELMTLEQQLLDPALRIDKAFLQRVLADDFEEIGQSGRLHDKASTMRDLPASPGFSVSPTIEGFKAREGSPGLVLTIYSIAETGTARSSLWRRTASGWELVFHQGTRPPQT